MRRPSKIWTDEFCQEASVLRELYRNHLAARRSLWTDEYISSEINFCEFRGDNAFIWQRNTSSASYAAAYRWLAMSESTLLGKCHEDGAFGAKVVNVNGAPISRDLLDSVAELGFLTSELGDLNSCHVLDIGAGYGRLGHRMWEAFPNAKYSCVDAVPESTAISRFYLNYRQARNCSVVALHEFEEYIAQHPVDVAVNVHSFSECPTESIEWWLRILTQHETEFLFLVPNTLTQLISVEMRGERADYAPLLRRYGWKRESARLKFRGRLRNHQEWPFQDVHILFVRT